MSYLYSTNEVLSKRYLVNGGEKLANGSENTVV